MKVAGFVMLLLLSHPNLVQAQLDQSDESFTHLIQAKTFKCVWEKGMVSEWKGGLAVVKETKMKEFTFDAIDHKKGTARLIANDGAGDVVMITTIAGIVFIEQTGMGNFSFTTVYAQKADTMEPRESYYAVHSRHMNMFFDKTLSSQYYGKCMIWG